MENIKKSKQEARLDALDKFETIVLGAKSMKEILTSYAQIHNDYMKIGVSNDEYKVAYLEELYKLFFNQKKTAICDLYNEVDTKTKMKYNNLR